MRVRARTRSAVKTHFSRAARRDGRGRSDVELMGFGGAQEGGREDGSLLPRRRGRRAEGRILITIPGVMVESASL